MRYDAFISYRHAKLDMYVAKKIHKGLETFRVPRAVTKKSGKKNIKRVFRDQEELPIGSDLGDNIRKALAESEYLLVICSPRTPESYWVQKEIDTFIKMHDREHVLAILVEGEPEESFPAQLLVDEAGNQVEPLAADVRGMNKREIDRRLKTEIIRLAAPLLSCSYDDLRQRHRERRMKKIAVASGMVAVLAVAFGGYNAYNASLIRQNLEGKQRNQSKYLADTSLSLLEEGNRRAAVLVALEALPSEENDRPYVPKAQYALAKALHCYDTGNEIQMDRNLRHDLPVSTMHMSAEGDKILSIDQGGTVYVWKVEDGTKLAQIAPRINESGYVISPIDAMIYEDEIIICDKECIRGVDFYGQELWSKDGYYIYCMLEEESGIAACVNGESVEFYQMSDGKSLGKMPNQVEASYCSEMAFTDDWSKFAVSHIMEDEDVTGCVSIYDFKTGSITDISTKPNYIADIRFGEGDELIIAGCMHAELQGDVNSNATGYVERYDVGTQTVVWCAEYEYQVNGFSAADAQLKCRKYQDEETGAVCDEVLMSVDQHAYTWDMATGEQISKTVCVSGIMSFLVGQSNSIGYLAEKSGTIQIADLATGTIYVDQAIETGKNLRDIQIKKGVIALRAYESPDITLMKFHEGTGMRVCDEYDSGVDEIDYSKEESYYAVDLYTDGFSYKTYFYRTKDGACVGSWNMEDDGYVENAGFVDDTTYAIISSRGVIYFYDVAEQKTTEFATENAMIGAKCDVNEAYTMALLCDGGKYCVVDLSNRIILCAGEQDEYIKGGIISEDGSMAYLCMESGVYQLNTQNEETTVLELDGHYVLSSGDVEDAFAISMDGSSLAISCEDGMLRIYDTGAKELKDSIPFAAQNRKYIEFSGDGQEILLQGDDYYFRVYDLAKQEFTHVATEQYYEIKESVADDETGTICLLTSADMLILNQEDYQCIAYVEEGNMYLPQNGKVLCSHINTLYEFPYMTLEMLRDEAKQQFGDDSLTELERTQYHVE